LDTSVIRIVDANVNRASEAARVIEDITRFHLAGEPLARESKSLRHAIREAPKAIGVSPSALCEARDAEGDVNARDLRSRRKGLVTVATANFRRLEEAFRVLEEISPNPSQIFSDLRYRTYTLEKKVVRLLGRRTPEVLAGPAVCVIVTKNMVPDPYGFIRQVISGGAGIIQLREKSLNDKEFRKYASAAHDITSEAGALLIVNDRADIACAAAADGVHVGADDLGVEEARRIVGDNRVVGATAHSKEEIRIACDAGADYIGFGPIFDTKTKAVSGATVSPDALAPALKASSVPVYAIGGIGPENVSHVRDAGARCVAVCASAASARNPSTAVAEMLKNLRK
jgi:thiamine-phosphate pyrophosphorylase